MIRTIQLEKKFTAEYVGMSETGHKLVFCQNQMYKFMANPKHKPSKKLVMMISDQQVLPSMHKVHIKLVSYLDGTHVPFEARYAKSEKDFAKCEGRFLRNSVPVALYDMLKGKPYHITHYRIKNKEYEAQRYVIYVVCFNS